MEDNKLVALSSSDKRAMLLKALQKKAGGLGNSHPISLFQEGLLFISHLQPDSFLYNMPIAIRLRGNLDRLALEQSFNEIVRRHIALRTVFKISEDGQPLQVIKPFFYQTLAMSDLSTFSEDDRETQAMHLVKGEGQYRFDLAEGPLFRSHLIRLREDEHWFFFVVHHIVFDLLSMEIFFQELGVLYGAFVTGKKSPIEDVAFSYVNFARWQRQWLQGETLSSQLAYWKRQLGGPLPVMELPTDYPRPAAPGGKGAIHSFSFSPALSEAIKALGRQEGATLFMTLFAAFTVLLHRYTQQDDILIGTPSANRDRAELSHLIGLFINTLVLRTDLSGSPTFRQLLMQVKKIALDAYTYQSVPFPTLVEALQPDRSTAPNPNLSSDVCFGEWFIEPEYTGA